MVSHVRPHLPPEPRTGTWQTPGSGAARRADRQGWRGGWRHRTALTISDLSVAQANPAGRIRPHAIVLREGCVRRLGQVDTGVASAGMAMTQWPEGLLDGSVAQPIVLFGVFLPCVHAGRVTMQSLACDGPPFWDGTTMRGRSDLNDA